MISKVSVRASWGICDRHLRRIKLVDHVDERLVPKYSRPAACTGSTPSEPIAIVPPFAPDAHRRDPPRTLVTRPERVVRQHIEHALAARRAEC